MEKVKISALITGILIILLGLMCIFRPMSTLVASSTIIGIILLASGIGSLLTGLGTRSWLFASNSFIFSAVLQIILGLIVLNNKLFVATALPVIFSIWIMIEGVKLAVNSSYYRRMGYGWWWLRMLLGIFIIFIGISTLGSPVSTSKTLTVLMGIGITAIGVSKVLGAFSLTKIKDNVKRVYYDPNDVDEQ